jgi:hypothetical protein
MTRRNIWIFALLLPGVALVFLLYVQPMTQANAGNGESSDGAIVVELFTSEGCSSCPPADALLRQIDGKQTQDGRRIIAISEHVTYWNHLGWSDPFSDNIYTQRQDEYGRQFHLDSVYTPQMVINGEEQIVGNYRDGLQRALERARERQPITIQIDSIDRLGDSLKIDYSLIGDLPAGSAHLVAVVADDSDRSNVARGENSGRVLTHVSVARFLKRFVATSSTRNQQLQIQLPRPANSSPIQSRRLILFVQVKGQGRILAADEKPF